MSSVNVYSPDYDSNGNPKPSIPDLKDAIENAVVDAENFASATGSFTDDNGNTYQKGAKGWAADAEGYKNTAQTAKNDAEAAESGAQTAESNAQGYAEKARVRTLAQLRQSKRNPNFFDEIPTNLDLTFSGFRYRDFAGGAEVNSDQTITIPAGDYVEVKWDESGRPFGLRNITYHVHDIYTYIVQSSPARDEYGGLLTCTYDDQDGYLGNPTLTEGPNGFYYIEITPHPDQRRTWLRIENTSSQEVTILWPVVTDQQVAEIDPPRPAQIQLFPTWEPELFGGGGIDDVAQQKHEEWRLDRYFSTNGDDANGGDRKNPLRNFDTVAPSLGQRIGLIGEDPTTAGTVFRQNLIDAIAEGASVMSVRRDPADDRVRISGLQQIADGDWSQDGTYTSTYATTFTSTDPLRDTQNKQFLYALEVDTTDEGPKAAGPSQRTFLKVVDSKTECDNTPGTCYVEDQSGNDDALDNTTWKIWIHPSNGTAPSSSKFTYEVNDLVGPLPVALPKSLHLRGLMLVGPNTGAMAEGRHMVTDRVHWRGGTKHHTVYHSGVARRCIWSGRCQTGIAHTFYEDGAQLRSGKLVDSLFLDTQSDHIFMHTSRSGSPFRYNEMVVRGTWFKNRFDQFSGNARDGIGAAIDMESVKDVTVENNYFNTVEICVRASGPRRLYVKENLAHGPFNLMVWVRSAEEVVRVEDNTSLCTGTYYSTRGDNTGRFWYLQDDLNDRLYIHNNLHVCFQPDMDGRVDLGTLGGAITENYYNIWVNANRNEQAAWLYGIGLQGGGNDPSGVTPSNYRADYNIYIRVNGRFNWRTTNSDLDDDNNRRLSKIQYYTDQEQNSVELDFRNDPRGIYAIFVDAPNGDFRLADTEPAREVAREVRRIERESGVRPGPARVTQNAPEFPTATEADRMITTP